MSVYDPFKKWVEFIFSCTTRRPYLQNPASFLESAQKELEELGFFFLQVFLLLFYLIFLIGALEEIHHSADIWDFAIRNNTMV